MSFYWVLMFAVFFLPTLLALCTGKRRLVVFVVNLCLGFTGLGWVAALALAVW